MEVLEEVREERKRQDELWGEQNHGDGMWLAILVEEVGEVANDINERSKKLREELIQVAAVACCWVEAIDRRE
mgnify:CR=1 FL=1